MEVLKVGTKINLFYFGACDKCGTVAKARRDELFPKDTDFNRIYAPCPICGKTMDFYDEKSDEAKLIK
jgi:hypothetical protein